MKSRPIFFILCLFFLTNILLLANYNSLIWDESTYISLGKHIFSGGELGFNEILRPIVLSSIIGIFWKLGLNVIIISKILAVLFSTGIIYLTFRIGKRMFGVKTALVSVLLVSTYPVFLEYSNKVLTGIPSTFFSLLSVYLLIKKKAGYAGIFAALSFLTRFPQALFFITTFIFLSAEYFEKRNRRTLSRLIKFSFASASVVAGFLILNLVMYAGDTSTWYHAMFRPFYYLFWNYSYVSTLGAYSMPLLFYIKGIFLISPLLILFFPFGVLKTAKRKRYRHLLLLTILFIAVLSLLSNKQMRHTIMFIPYLSLISARGLTSIRLARKKVFIFLVMLVMLLSLAVYVKDHDFNRETPEMVSEYYGFLAKYPVSGKIFITDPHIAAYYDYPVDAAYYDLDHAIEKSLKNNTYDLVFYSERSFPCQDEGCRYKREEIMKHLLLSYGLVFEKDYYGSTYYIFSNKDYIGQIPKEHLLIRYGLLPNADLSKKPFGLPPLIIIFEDFPSLDENLDRIWQKEKYDLVWAFIKENDLKASAAVVPMHLNYLEPSQLEMLRDSGLSLIQNGFSHKENYEMTYEDELKLLQEGNNIIKQRLRKNAAAFIPPFYYSTPQKVKAIQDAGFNIYISNSGDLSEPNITRYDQTLTLVKIWDTKELKGTDELSAEITYANENKDYILISVYYYMHENTDQLEDFLELTSENLKMDIYEYDAWNSFVRSLEYTENQSSITLKGPDSDFFDMLTLEFYESANYTLISDYPKLNMMNKNTNQIEICINQRCSYLLPGRISEIIV